MLTSRILLLAGTLALGLPAVAAAAPVKLTATLAPEADGDAKGSGKFSGTADVDNGDFCYTLSAKTSDKPMAAHVHSGAAGTSGPPVITLMVTGDNDDECVAVEPDTLKAILAAPDTYYVNVHTATYPKGAVRGQLSK